jgi:hypothetical protein
MPVSDVSIANLKSNAPVPVGSTRKANGNYYKKKLEDGRWVYTHKLAAEEYLKRRLNPNERIYFFKDKEVNYESPVYGVDFEVRLVPPRNSIPGGTRRKLIKRIRQAEYDLNIMKNHLAKVNEFYGKAPDDMEDPGIPPDWQPKDSRNVSVLG